MINNGANSSSENTKEGNDLTTMADDAEKSAISTAIDTNSPTPAPAESQQNANANDDDDQRRFCRICYGTDEESASELCGLSQEWVHPCKCSGTIKWVHRGCFGAWLDQAPYQQRFQCTMCKYIYRSSWRIKPLTRWCIPDLKLTIWDGLEISLDVMATYGLFRRLEQLIKGTAKSMWTPYFWAMMYRVFVMNNRRLNYYHQLGLRALSSILEASVQNAVM